MLKVLRIINFILLILIIKHSLSFAQGMSRSTGLGIRASFWNITNHPTRIGVSDYGQSAKVDVSGAGAWMYFFSRIRDNWYFEFSLGGIGGVHLNQTSVDVEELDVTAVVPLLLGVRNDLFSSRASSHIQPYLCFGGGPYWSTLVSGGDDFSEGGEQIVESDMMYGAYLGGGMYLTFTDWFAWNFDLKYHFVEFQYEEGYSGLEFGTGFSFMWGKKREIFRVKEIIPVVHELYPAYYQFYSTHTLALVRIQNISDYPIEVNIRSQISGYSDRIKETGYVSIEKGELKDIPVSAIFSQNIERISERKAAVLDIEIEVRAGKTVKKEFSTQIIVHSKNAWDGEMNKLSLFVTPDNQEIIRMTRAIVNKMDLSLHQELENYHIGMQLFNELQKQGIRYHSDPNIPFYKDDRVQYATETLKLNGGDCDDLVVLYASLLESLGIKTAFIEVRDPEKNIAHLYLIFDSGLPPEKGTLISSNPKRYIIRDNKLGRKKVWIPVETTLVANGFEEAWKSGAKSYLTEGTLRNGIADGWVRIIDVE